MKSTFSVIYYLKRQVVKKDGTVPVMGRITVDGSQTQFSCKLTVDPKLWDTKGGRVTGRSTAALETNRMLDKMRVRINRHYQEIMERDNFVIAKHPVMLRGTAEEEFCDVIMRFCRWGPKVFCMFILSCTRLMLSLGKITWIIQYNDETRKVYSGSDGYQPGKTTGGTYGVGRGNGEKCS